jgi:hypothetical protein
MLKESLKLRVASIGFAPRKASLIAELQKHLAEGIMTGVEQRHRNSREPRPMVTAAVLTTDERIQRDVLFVQGGWIS